MLEPGDPAPDIEARNQYDEGIEPDFAEPTVVFFYPKDFTGGCTTEVGEFQETLPQFREGGVTVYGVSMDDVQTHAEFADAEGLVFDLLADPNGDVAAAFGLSTAEGRTDRVTFVLADGTVTAVYEPSLPDPSGHAREVLRDVRNEHVQGG